MVVLLQLLVVVGSLAQLVSMLVLVLVLVLLLPCAAPLLQKPRPLAAAFAARPWPNPASADLLAVLNPVPRSADVLSLKEVSCQDLEKRGRPRPQAAAAGGWSKLLELKQAAVVLLLLLLLLLLVLLLGVPGTPRPIKGAPWSPGSPDPFQN